jgi:hypothetical protein
MDTSIEKLFTNLYHAYIHISKACGCSLDRVKFARHTCALKCISKEDIEVWFTRDIHQNYSLVQAVIVVMSIALLDLSLDTKRWVEMLENKFEWDLTGLVEIISDYRAWHINYSNKGEVDAVNEQYDKKGEKCSVL